MKNTPNYGFWILTHGAFNFNNSFNFSIFSNFSNGVQRKLVKLHLLGLNEIPKVFIFKLQSSLTKAHPLLGCLDLKGLLNIVILQFNF